ncbi:MAG: O-antigen ligase family protein [Candidatus Levybacteria bacterium]|nr:O-antigen ligase family protein [Candidatus Levybacteria bacterium]
MNIIKICNKIIEYSFYALFLLVPLAFTSATSELFEMNKMWLTWGLTIVIAMSWLIKMTLQRKFFVRRTPLDIPIVLFLFFQIISTIFSLDSHVSLWGYYSRFNGGLFSIISYIFLYYAFLSNFQTNAVSMVKRSLFLSLISGLIVALWGLPSRFGYDPTCFLFRGKLDVSCWTADFMPRIKIFSTLGQPNWLAAYLAILIPISIAFFINNLKSNLSTGNEYQVLGIKFNASKKYLLRNIFYLMLAALFYVDLLYTNSQSGFLGIWLALIFFTATYFWLEKKRTKLAFSIETLKSPISIFLLGFLLLTFVIGMPIAQLRGFTLNGIGGFFQKFVTTQAPKKTEIQIDKEPTQPLESVEGGTGSGEIRLSVWSGAISAWKANPLFGTGVETFAFAYYKYKPASQNLTSEWNFLYNKAHNEYLNYLATTGLFGLGTYLLMIGSFLTTVILKLKNEEESQNNTLIIAVLAGYISILITNFFGFSVVMTNVYLFMIPAFIFVLSQQVGTKTTTEQANKATEIEDGTPVWQWTPIFLTLAIGFFMLSSLFKYWQADIAFALGYNLDRAGEYQQAYPKLHEAVKLRGNEPVLKDELSLNDAIVAAALVSQKPQDANTQQNVINTASSLAQEAINVSNEVVSQHPNNAVFWKTRVRIFYTLSQVDSRYLPRAMDAIEKASILAPNDANIWYNLGVLYGQNNNLDKGISTLERTILLKPDYRDAHYGLGLFYHQKAIDKDGNVIDSALQQKAIAQMQYILDHLSPKDTAARQSIDDWSK